MPTNKFERDFRGTTVANKKPNRLDGRLFGYNLDAGDGYPGLQWMLRHIVVSFLFRTFAIEGCEYDGVSTLSAGSAMLRGTVVVVPEQTGITVANGEILYIDENGVAHTTTDEDLARNNVIVYERTASGLGCDARLTTVNNILFLWIFSPPPDGFLQSRVPTIILVKLTLQVLVII